MPWGNGANFLYVANFKGRTIDVFDKNFAPVTDKPFADPTIPAGFGPFNIQALEGKLYVAYAKLKAPDNEDDEAGPGNGYVDVFTPAGILEKRLVTGGALNSPWGLVRAPASFGEFNNALLVGNFGDELIHAYDEQGQLLGTLKDQQQQPIHIDGLWTLVFPTTGLSAEDQQHLYFTAGPQGETHGLFGYLK
ncbi:hypothetical protein GCM10028824_32970 [Hymenobacter segetis]|uniref:TIGR03118 family protein n=1 Tax=Hymenobacter segetis TaxID=2025509 RepID=A0ABU9LWA8_9BACT